MTIPIGSDEELNSILKSLMMVSINNVTEKVMELLLKSIDDIVYDPYKPVEYDRQRDNGGLRGSWDKSDPMMLGNTIQQKIEHDPTKLTLDKDRNIHGSDYRGVSWDVRDFLIDMIINGDSRSPRVGSRFDYAKDKFFKRSRDFWTPFIKILEDGTCDRLFEEEFRKVGLTYRKVA